MSSQPDLSSRSQSSLSFLQSLSEAEFTELVVMPLLETLGFREIRKTHGPSERGKDIVFARYDPILGRLFQAAAVKNKPLSGSASGSNSIVTTINQLRQALSEPYPEPSDGSHERIERAYLFNSHPITPSATEAIRGQLSELWSKVAIVDGARLMDLINENLPGLLVSLGNPETKYHYQLANRFRKYAPLGNSEPSGKLRLHDFYIQPRLAEVTPSEARSMSFATNYEVPSNALSLGQWRSTPGNTVVLADVGSGKTTLMQRLVLDLFDGKEGGVRDPLPLYIPLSHFPVQSADAPANVLQQMATLLETEHGLPFGNWDDLSNYETQPILLLLDGFDELPGGHAQMEQALELIGQCATIKVVITSRPSRIPTVRSFTYWRLCPFGRGDVSNFLAAWFAERPDLADELCQRILASESLSILCQTPLMLTLYALLASSSSDSIDSLPTRRTEIYSKVVELLLGRWDSLRGLKNTVSVDAKFQILEAIAFQMHEKRIRLLEAPKAEVECERVMKSRLARSYRRNSASLAWDEIIFRSSLMRFGDDYCEVVEFAHLSFQEYFASQRLLRLADAKKVMSLARDNWWRNSLKFYFGHCRSIDSVLNNHRSKRDAISGLQLLEFLEEADFSSPKSQESVYTLAGQELLLYDTLSDADLAMCRRMGDPVIKALEAAITKITQGEHHEFSGWSPVSFCRILVFMGSPRATEALSLLELVMGQLSMTYLIEVARIGLGSPTPHAFQRLVTNAMQHLEKRIPEVPSKSWKDAKSTILGLVDFARECSLRENEGKSNIEMANAWKKIDFATIKLRRKADHRAGREGPRT